MSLMEPRRLPQNHVPHGRGGSRSSRKVLRPICVYVFLVVLLRIFGKRELAQLNPFDLVVLLSLANTVQNAIIGDDTSLVGGLIGAFSLCACNYLVVRFLFKHRRLDQLIEGTPTVLIENGKLCRKGIARELLNESRADDRGPPPGVRLARRGREVRPGTRRDLLHQGKQPRALAQTPCGDRKARRIDQANRGAASRLVAKSGPTLHVRSEP